MSAGALSEDFEDEPGAVDHLGLPAPFEVALLHRAERGVDDDEANRALSNDGAQILDIAAAEQRRRDRPRNAHDLRADDVEVDRPRQRDRLVEAGFERAPGILNAADSARLRRRMNDEGAAGRRDRWREAAVQSSSGSLPPSNSWIGCAGITVEIACL